MAELLTIKNISIEVKIELLKELGFKTDKIFVLDKDGKKHLDRYTNAPVRLDNMLILDDNLPGSTIIIDNNSLSVSSFLEEFGDVI